MFWRTGKEKPPRVFYDRLPTHDPADVDGMLDAMRTDGFVLIPGVLQDYVIEETRARIDALKPLQWDFTGSTDHFKTSSTATNSGCRSSTARE